MSAITDAITTYRSSKGRGVYKPLSYAPIYEKYLEPLVWKEVVLAEIGIGFGGCLQMWSDHLGPQARIIGIDKSDHKMTQQLINDHISIRVGDQSDTQFLAHLHSTLPMLDVLIDDGSHVCSHQIKTLEALWSKVKHGGLYFCEDAHTSYRAEVYGGGYKEPGSFIEYVKHVVDAMHHQEDEQILVDHDRLRPFANMVDFIHFYPSLVVIKKKDPNA